MMSNVLEMTFRGLGDESIAVEQVGSEKVWNTENLSFQMKYAIKISFDGRSDLFYFTDSVQDYRCGIDALDGVLLAKAFHDNLTSAYLYGSMSLDDFCKKFAIFSRESCSNDYETMKIVYEKMERLLGIGASEMKEMASEIFERYEYFPHADEVVERW